MSEAPASKIGRGIRQSLVYGIGSLSNSALSFILIPLYTRQLTAAEYGVLSLLQTMSSLLSAMMGLGISYALFRSYFDQQAPERCHRVAGTAFVIATVVPGVLLALVGGLAPQISELLLGAPAYEQLVVLLLLTLFFELGLAIPMTLFRAREQPQWFAAISVGKLALNLVANICLVAGFGLGVAGVVYGGLFSAAAAYLTALILMRPDVRPSFEWALARQMLAFSLPLVPFQLASWVLTLSDRYFLRYFDQLSTVGIYSLGYRFGLLMNILVVQPFLMAWRPFLFSVSRRDDARRIYALVFTYFAGGAAFVWLGLSLLSVDVIRLVSGPEFQAAAAVVPWVAVAYMAYGWFYALDAGVLILGKTHIHSCIGVIAALINLALNVLLIPRYGAHGAAWATALSYGLMPVAMWLSARRIYPVNYETTRLLKIAATTALLYLAGRLAPAGLSWSLTSAWHLLASLLFIPVLFLFRIPKPGEVTIARRILQRFARRPLRLNK